MGKRKSFEQKSVQGHEEEDVKFAKRRNSLYKKAQELSILCGSDIAVVIISRATGKVSTYGSPDPGIVIGRYQSRKKNVQDGARSESRKVIMTKDEKKMKHLVRYEEENLGTIPNTAYDDRAILVARFDGDCFFFFALDALIFFDPKLTASGNFIRMCIF